MIKVSDLLGKSVISLTDAKNVGYVANVWFDAKLQRAKTAEIVSDDDDYPERAYAELRNMQCEGDAAILRSAAAITPANPASAVLPCPINRDSFNQSGKALGKVRDVLLEGCTVQEIVCEKARFTPKELLSLGDNLCLFNDTGAPIKLPKPAKPRAQKSAPPHRADAYLPLYPGVQTPPAPQAVKVTRTPGDPVKDYSFLMGKPVHSPVVCNGRVLIPAGTTVTEQIIELARRENKLVQLALRAY